MAYYPTNTPASAYLKATGFGFPTSENPIANGPILPTNIVTEITAFPIVLRAGVIPVDRPTPLKADTTSNNTCRKDAFSVTVNIPVASTTHKMAIEPIAKALFIVWGEIRLLKRLTSSLPVNSEKRNNNIIPKDTVLIPAPVPPGEAPMNIQKIIIKRLVGFIPPILIVLNPVVVEAEIDLKEELNNLSLKKGD